MRGIAIALAVLLAGCGQDVGQEPANDNAANASAPAATANLPSMEEALETQENAGNAAAEENATGGEPASGGDLGTLPPADAALRFVGTWAKDRAGCSTNPWRFTAKALTVRDGPNCTFYKVTKAPGGYDIAAQCPGKEPIHTDLIKLRFAESARAMLVESNAISPMGLIYCGK